MIRLAKYIAPFALAVVMSSPAFAAIDYSDDFESYTEYVGTGSIGDIGGGWLVFANVFTDYPGCTAYEYGYGPFPAPNQDGGFSNITAGNTGLALNAYSNYGDTVHADGKCLETSVFQERIFSAVDVGTYDFEFDVQVPIALGTGVSTYGFIKLLDPVTFATDVFLTVDTASAGDKSIRIELDATADGKILQWGFSTVASNYEASGRWYDNVTFAPAAIGPPILPLIEGIPIPSWALLLMVGMLGYLGASRLRARKEA